MPFALIGIFLAFQETKQFDWWKLIAVILSMVFARNSAMAFNRWIDRDIDAKNDRTAKREIPAGTLKPNSVLFFVILNALLFITTTFFINNLAFYLSPVALIVVLGYSLTKRFTALCHFILGLGLALAPLGAYLAVTGEFRLHIILLGFAVLTWVAGFDIIYALQDQNFDKSENLKSVPSMIGTKNSIILSTFLHLLTMAALAYFSFLLGANYLNYAGLIIFSLLLAYQHLLVKPNDFSRINLAFFTTNGVASVVYAIFVIPSFYF